MLSSITFGACSARNPRKTSSGCATFGRQRGWSPAGMIQPSRSAKHILPGAIVRLPCPGSRECLWHTSAARRQVSPRECATFCAMTLLALKPRSRACSFAVQSTAGILLVSRPRAKGRLGAVARDAAPWPKRLITWVSHAPGWGSCARLSQHLSARPSSTRMKWIIGGISGSFACRRMSRLRRSRPSAKSCAARPGTPRRVLC